MTLNKPTFFAALFCILIGPFLIGNSLWIANSRSVNGTMRYAGKSYSGQLPREFAVIRFFLGKDTVWFNGMDNYLFRKDEIVPVRYQADAPKDARINSFIGLWGDTLIYMSPLLLIIIICFFHPDLVPRRSKILLNFQRPFIEIL